MYKVTIETHNDRLGESRTEEVIFWFYDYPQPSHILGAWKGAHYNVFAKNRWAKLITAKITEDV